jgi:DNA-binding transcriptional regulator YiaG
MNNTDKSGVILKFWNQITESRKFNEDDILERNSNETFIAYTERILETIILKYANTKPAKELFQRLKIDGVFKVVKDTTNPKSVEIIYNNDYLPYRLDLANFSIYGFTLGNGHSSTKQLSLAVLATASNDSYAKKHYQDFMPYVIEVLLQKKEISYIQIQQWIIKKKRDNMKNIVKYVCSELDITQKALAEEIGVSEGTVNRWSAKPEDVPLQTHKTLLLLLENAQLKANQDKLHKAISLLEEVKNSQNNSI